MKERDEGRDKVCVCVCEGVCVCVCVREREREREREEEELRGYTFNRHTHTHELGGGAKERIELVKMWELGGGGGEAGHIKKERVETDREKGNCVIYEGREMRGFLKDYLSRRMKGRRK